MENSRQIKEKKAIEENLIQMIAEIEDSLIKTLDEILLMDQKISTARALSAEEKRLSVVVGPL